MEVALGILYVILIIGTVICVGWAHQGGREAVHLEACKRGFGAYVLQRDGKREFRWRGKGGLLEGHGPAVITDGWRKWRLNEDEDGGAAAGVPAPRVPPDLTPGSIVYLQPDETAEDFKAALSKTIQMVHDYRSSSPPDTCTREDLLHCWNDHPKQ